LTPKDNLFDDDSRPVLPFEFNENVAHVFDDMAERSIPFYKEVQRLITSLVLTFYQKESSLLDLGCSTGTTLCLNAQALSDHGITGQKLIGIDNSGPMCREAEKKVAGGNGFNQNISILEGDINSERFEPASVIIMNYTLQFIPPFQRELLLNKIFKALVPNGILLVSDKILQSCTDISRIFVDHYYQFKRGKGYSEMEISRKREALENVLIPYTIKEEKELFQKAGFSGVDIFFSWYNFSSFICFKKA